MLSCWALESRCTTTIKVCPNTQEEVSASRDYKFAVFSKDSFAKLLEGRQRDDNLIMRYDTICFGVFQEQCESS